MEVRPAIEDDAEAMAAIANAPVDAMINLIHDRSVRVAVEQEPRQSVDDTISLNSATPESVSDEEEPVLVGFVSFDAREDAVHVTQLDGLPAVRERLLGEPIRFAEREEMAVELLVPETEAESREAAERVGFELTGRGPRFDGVETVRYRLRQ